MKKNVIICLIIISSLLAAIRSFAATSAEQSSFVTATESNSQIIPVPIPFTKENLPPGAQIVNAANKPVDIIYGENVLPPAPILENKPLVAPTPPQNLEITIPKITVKTQIETNKPSN